MKTWLEIQIISDGYLIIFDLKGTSFVFDQESHVNSFLTLGDSATTDRNLDIS